MDEDELEPLLDFDGAAFEMAAGMVVEFSVRRTEKTRERPHGIGYSLVLRPVAGGTPWVRFDNAHAPRKAGKGYRPKPLVYDHWHRTAKDPGRPYNFTTVAQLLDDFWREVKRTLDEKGIPTDL
ncbi:MAG: toxin-antitoxin system TumE family protein [Candidatus Binataceae bacterium]